MVICGVCGQNYDDMKEKHSCPGPLDLNKPATLGDIIELRREMDRFRTEVWQKLAMLARRPEYVPPPVYGPITYQCPHCGTVLHGSEAHNCTGRY